MTTEHMFFTFCPGTEGVHMEATGSSPRCCSPCGTRRSCRTPPFTPAPGAPSFKFAAGSSRRLIFENDMDVQLDAVPQDRALLQGSSKDTFCPFETWFFSTKIKENRSSQGNVQVYNVRIPVLPCIYLGEGSPTKIDHRKNGYQLILTSLYWRT